MFSVAKDGFVNVFTKGIIKKDHEDIDETISFRIYDAFRNENQVPSDFPKDIKDNIIEKINLLHKERQDRGIPGYYFPLHINNENDTILDFFDKGYVTVIEIPFDSIESINPLFEEIKKIHFDFIQLKYSKNFKISFINP